MSASAESNLRTLSKPDTVSALQELTRLAVQNRTGRFSRLILSVDALRPVDWSELAQTAGYFDQAHFIREFKDFTGHTPTGYLALRRRFPAEPELTDT